MIITSPLSTVRNVLTAGVLVAFFTLTSHAAGLAVQQISTGLDGLNAHASAVGVYDSQATR
jgi:hypothetical protein